ncbi:unnamed protein product, partial [Ectocarpus sp. 13 AM-2016]
LTNHTAVDTTHDVTTTSRTHAYGSRTTVLLLLPGEAPASGCISCQGDGRDQATYWLLMWLRTRALANFVSFDTTMYFDVYAPHLLRTQRERKSRICLVGALAHTLDKAISRQKREACTAEFSALLHHWLICKIMPVCTPLLSMLSPGHPGRGIPFCFTLGRLLPQ